MPIQYGESWSAWCAYLNTYQHLPLERISQLFEDLTGHRPSEATLLSHLEKLSIQLEPIENTSRQNLVGSKVVHADETGMRIEGKLHWLHTVCNDKWTLYNVHQKRGKEAINAMGVLPAYKGIVVHDFWKPYFNADYDFTHALCGVHLLRECQGIIDYDKHQWASEIQALLREALKKSKQASEAGRPLEPEVISDIETNYDEIISRGTKQWRPPLKPDVPGKRGRKAKGKAANLAERFILYKADILRFLQNALVPFDNSQAERDIRMVKVKEKVSGSFRTEKGAIQFARIRGFISTIRKQGKDLLDSIILVNRGQFTFS
ncbi:IS66 family transposase [Aneurinibacillus tyrosinisolvens]|uniref:IS66 family transposase n=1 Tax=Aneurinibacillus tyrosinisolvens TaxID=1443435 RepID=UPI00069BB37B|nr:IS66 family transposase [Aneurinibacillus tyrosinisolvens]